MALLSVLDHFNMFSMYAETSLRLSSLSSILSYWTVFIDLLIKIYLHMQAPPVIVFSSACAGVAGQQYYP